MKNKISNIAEILLSAMTLPLWFIKMFTGIGHLPNQNGEIVEVVFRHSMYENISDAAHPVLAYAAMAVAVASVILSAVNLKVKDRRLQIFCNVTFGVAMGAFAVLLLCASSVRRGY